MTTDTQPAPRVTVASPVFVLRVAPSPVFSKGDRVKFIAPFETYQKQTAKIIRLNGNMATLRFDGDRRLHVGFHVSKLVHV